MLGNARSAVFLQPICLWVCTELVTWLVWKALGSVPSLLSTRGEVIQLLGVERKITLVAVSWKNGSHNKPEHGGCGERFGWSQQTEGWVIVAFLFFLVFLTG